MVTMHRRILFLIQVVLAVHSRHVLCPMGAQFSSVGFLL